MSHDHNDDERRRASFVNDDSIESTINTSVAASTVIVARLNIDTAAAAVHVSPQLLPSSTTEPQRNSGSSSSDNNNDEDKSDDSSTTTTAYSLNLQPSGNDVVNQSSAAGASWNSDDFDRSRQLRWLTMNAQCKDIKVRRAINHRGLDALDHVLFSPRLRFGYCKLGKVSSSTWLTILNSALGDPHPHLRASTRLRTYHQLPFAVRQYFKFVFVRHPFDRLISAYIDKFGSQKSEYWTELAPTILRRYRANPSRRSLRQGNDVRFDEFIKYIVDPRSHPLNDFHWSPQTELCQPCRVGYDFIGHYETLYDDADYVLAKLRLTGDKFRFPRRHPSKLNRWETRVRTMFANTSQEHITRLKDIYRYDFQLLGYDPII
jgi:chondroitin 4-sulfotransferase 11